jgi:hypothetical protein
MHKYEFRFLNGVAEVVCKEDGQVLLHQPFKPMDAIHGPGPHPWDSEEEAYAWTQANFNHHLEELHEDFLPEPVPEIKPGTCFNKDGSINYVKSQRLWDLEARGIDITSLTATEIWGDILTAEELAEEIRVEEEQKKEREHTSVGTGN